MSLYAFCLAGGSFIVIGAWESLTSTLPHLTSTSSSSSSFPSLSPPQPPKKPNKSPFLSSITYATAALISFSFILNALISLHNALNAKDSIGFAFQLQIISVASLFLLYSVTGLLTNLTVSVPFPVSIHNLIALFAFGQEFLHFYLQRKDPTGLENRYFDLMLVPVTICVFATVLDCGFPRSNWPGLVRGIGMVLQGTWFAQMGFSFFTDLITHGCVLHERSSGNFTVRCKGHMEVHRSKAIATLQFNSHLAFLLVVVLGIYSVVARKYGFGEDHLNYMPINSELRRFDGRTQFTLDSDEDDDEEENVVERNGLKMKDVGGATELRVNGFGGH